VEWSGVEQQTRSGVETREDRVGAFRPARSTLVVARGLLLLALCTLVPRRLSCFGSCVASSSLSFLGCFSPHFFL